MRVYWARIVAWASRASATRCSARCALDVGLGRDDLGDGAGHVGLGGLDRGRRALLGGLGPLEFLLPLVGHPLVDGLAPGQLDVADVFLLAEPADGRGLADLGLPHRDGRLGGRDRGLGRRLAGLRLLDGRLGPLDLGGGQLDLLLPLGVVDLGQDLPLLDGVADVHHLRPQVAGRLGIQVGVLEGVERPRLGRRPGHAALVGMDRP